MFFSHFISVMLSFSVQPIGYFNRLLVPAQVIGVNFLISIFCLAVWFAIVTHKLHLLNVIYSACPGGSVQISGRVCLCCGCVCWLTCSCKYQMGWPSLLAHSTRFINNYQQCPIMYSSTMDRVSIQIAVQNDHPTARAQQVGLLRYPSLETLSIMSLVPPVGAESMGNWGESIGRSREHGAYWGYRSRPATCGC